MLTEISEWRQVIMPSEIWPPEDLLPDIFQGITRKSACFWDSVVGCLPGGTADLQQQLNLVTWLKHSLEYTWLHGWYTAVCLTWLGS